MEATLPAVGAAIGDITSLFYNSLFQAHPELLRDLFNRGNQANGSQRQALAGSIAAFAAALIADPDQRPDAMLARIAHKHASRSGRPERNRHPRRNHRIPVRPAALPAHPTPGPRRARSRHPLRGLRPRPVARPQLTNPRRKRSVGGE